MRASFNVENVLICVQKRCTRAAYGGMDMLVTEKLRQLREHAGMSMDELAKAMGYKGQSGIQRYEDPRQYTSSLFRLDFVEKLAKALVGKGNPPIKRFEVLSLAVSPAILSLGDIAAKSDEELSARSPSNASSPRQVEMPLERIPVYGQAVAGADGRFVFNGQRLSDVIAPPILVGVPDAYAVYVVGESMEPRYYAGEVVYVHPRLPVRRGDFVVAQIDVGEDAPAGFVKRFVGLSDKLTLEQINPPGSKLMTFPGNTVVSVHRIVMAGQG